MSKTITSAEYNAWLEHPLTKGLKRSFQQSITDPENQPSQYGTVTLEMYEALEDQLAAAQVYAEQLLEALEKLATIANQYAGHYPYQVATIVDAALSLPADTSALDAYVAAKVKEAGKFDMWKTNPYTKVLETSIEQLTKQRDLAVEALEKWDMFFGGDAETAVLTIAEDPSTLTGCQKATKEAMSAIKESEAK